MKIIKRTSSVAAWYVLLLVGCVCCLVTQVLVFIPEGSPIRVQLVRLSNRTALLRPLVAKIVDVDIELETDPRKRSINDQNARGEAVHHWGHGVPGKNASTVNATWNLTHAVTHPLTVIVSRQCRVTLVLSVPVPAAATCTAYRIVCDAAPDYTAIDVPVTNNGTHIAFPRALLRDSDVRYVVTCVVANQNHSVCYTSGVIVHSCGSSSPSGPALEPWHTRYRAKYHNKWGEEYLAHKGPESAVSHQCRYRNVTVTVQASRSIFDSTHETIRPDEFRGFALGEFRYFIMLMRRFGGFELAEYRIGVVAGGHSMAKNELGVMFAPSEIHHQLFETGHKQCTDTAHAFIGSGVIPFGIPTLEKGFQRLLAGLSIHVEFGIQMMRNTLYEWQSIGGDAKDMPLINMMAHYADNRKSKVYGLKAEMLLLLLSNVMENAVPGSFCKLFKWMYANRRVGGPGGLTPERLCEGVALLVGNVTLTRDDPCMTLFSKYYTGDHSISADPVIKKVVAEAGSRLRDCDNF